MHALIICKFDEEPIRNEVSISQTTFSQLNVYRSLKGQLTHVNSLIWSKVEVHDFMLIFITCKLDEDLIKSKVATALTFSQLYVYGTF